MNELKFKDLADKHCKPKIIKETQSQTLKDRNKARRKIEDIHAQREIERRYESL